MKDLFKMTCYNNCEYYCRAVSEVEAIAKFNNYITLKKQEGYSLKFKMMEQIFHQGWVD